MEHKAKKKKVREYFRGTEVGLMIEVFQGDLKMVAEGHSSLDKKVNDLQSQFKVFGESLDDVKKDLRAVKKRGDETFEEVGNIKVEITAIKIRLDSIEKRLSRIESNPAKAQAEIESLKKESMELKSCSDDKDVQERLSLFEARIGRIEKQLKLSAA